MSKETTKEAAEALLRELPSVIGACVREDVYGHPREIHLLVRAGPNPRHLAYDVRDLLEERLGIPIDQRVISIAQLAPGKRPGPLLAGFATPDPNTAPSAGATTSSAEPAPPAAPASGSTATAPPPRGGVYESDATTVAPAPDDGVQDAAGDEPVRAAADPDDEPREPRILFTGMVTESIDNRVRIRITLDLNGVEYAGEAIGLDTAAARLRTCATATLRAVDLVCAGRARFEVEQISTLLAFEREYIMVSATVSSPSLGRRAIPLVGAQPVEVDGESAVALAALKAINRTLSLLLRLGEPVVSKPRQRVRQN